MILLWRLPDGEFLKSQEGALNCAPRGSNDIYYVGSLTISPDKQLLASGHLFLEDDHDYVRTIYHEVWIERLFDGSAECELPGLGENGNECLSFSPD